MLEYVNYIRKNNLGVVYTNKTFKTLTTIKIGGKIRLLYYPNTMGNFIKFYRFYLDNKKYPINIIGNGSNILASDKEYEGVLVCFKKIHFKYAICNNVFSVTSGVMINDCIHYLKNISKGCFEKLYYIPATIGGMVKMNAGAYNCNISDNILNIKTIDNKGKIKVYKKEELIFEYRKTNIDEIILEVSFVLHNENKEKIIKDLEEIKKDRLNKYPLSFYNAGSTFKNPVDNKSWLLIDRLGLRGLNINDAQVSNKHCNFLINIRNSSSDDMVKLLNLVKDKVKNAYNINLECEWNLINF